MKRRTISFLFAAMATLAIVAIGAFVATHSSVAAGAPDHQFTAGATGCDPAISHKSGDFDEQVMSGGITRDYILHVPQSYTGDQATPLVLNFHGLGGTAAHQAEYSGLPEKSDEAGFILVTPNGSITDFFPQRHWNFLLGIPESPDDVLFVSDLLDQVSAQLCVDAARVYATGISNGAMMSVRLACDLSDRIAAIAPVAGVYFPPWSPDLAIEPGCDATRPVPVIAFHGTADDVVPFDGGPLGIFNLQFELSSIEDEAIPAWAAHNGCTRGPTNNRVATDVYHVQFNDCGADASVDLYVTEGGGHLWPGADDLPQPDVNDEVSATDLIWDFFQAHSLTYLTGDAGCNGKLDSIDAALMLQMDAGLVDSLSCPADADVNGDGAVDSRDAALILQFVAGFIPALPL